MRSGRRNRYLVGPLLGPIPHEGHLRFLVPAILMDRVGESALRGGFSTSPDSIIRAYKAAPAPGEMSSEELDWECFYWLLVESSAHDYVKHFKGTLRRGAFRIPRLLTKKCPKCDDPLFGKFCRGCGEPTEEAKYVEVWRDKSAHVKTLGPFYGVQEELGRVKFVGEGVEYLVPRIILREIILSAKPSDGRRFYLRILSFEGDEPSQRQPVEHYGSQQDAQEAK